MGGIAALSKIIQPVKFKINLIQPSKTFLNPSYSPKKLKYMTKSSTLHRSKGVRVSPCFQTIGVEGEEKNQLSQEPPAVTSEEESRSAAGVALSGWQSAKNIGGACLRERKREARASASTGEEGESWVGGQRRNK